jgi:two-component system phosphate regulon sensor histidine kinase PhoR
MTLVPALLLLAFITIVILAIYLGKMRIALRLARSRRVPPDPVEVSRLPTDTVTIEALADPALLVDVGLRVVAANAAARDLFGSRIVAEDLRLVLRHPAVLDLTRLAIAGSEPMLREVTSLGIDNGAFRVRAVMVDGGQLLLTFADITQTRLTERMRVDFVANASHELRTPLATLTGFIETLQGPAAEDAPARERFLEIMSREAARMSRLIDDLLSLSRIELDKYVRPQVPLALPPLFADVAKTLAMRLEADERRLRIVPAADLPDVIADRDQILQVLHNLVSNALKYGRSGSEIVLRAEPFAGGVRVTVSDKSDGIAAEHLPRLTERFYRVDTSRSRKMGGTGLGLAIVKHIIERHRGQFEIVSHLGEGTSVSFTLPTVVPPAVSQK